MMHFEAYFFFQDVHLITHRQIMLLKYIADTNIHVHMCLKVKFHSTVKVRSEAHIGRILLEAYLKDIHSIQYEQIILKTLAIPMLSYISLA